MTPTTVTFTLEYLSIPSLKLLARAQQIEIDDYSMAQELTQADHDAMAAALKATKAEIAKRPDHEKPQNNVLHRACRISDIDKAVRLVQDALDIDTGDVAGVAFSGLESDEWERASPATRNDHIANWLATEGAI